MAGEQRCRHQVRNNCGEIMLQAHKHSPAATHHRCEHQNSQHSDSSRDFSWRNYGEILEDDGSRTVMVILVTGYGAIIKSDLITDKRRWRGLVIVNCSCNLLGAEHTLDCDSMLVLVYCHCATFGWEPEFPQMTMETFTNFL